MVYRAFWCHHLARGKSQLSYQVSTPRVVPSSKLIEGKAEVISSLPHASEIWRGANVCHTRLANTVIELVATVRNAFRTKPRTFVLISSLLGDFADHVPLIGLAEEKRKDNVGIGNGVERNFEVQEGRDSAIHTWR